MRSTQKLLGGLGLGVILLAALLPQTTEARPEYFDAWVARYPESTLPDRMAAQTGSECSTCHHPPFRSLPGTCYRESIRNLLNQGLTIEQALGTVESFDSDGDGVTNIAEILLAREDLPGEVGYHPGLIGLTGTDPCADDPGEVVSNQAETPPNPAGLGDAGGIERPLALRLSPNPAPGGQTEIAFRADAGVPIELAIFDVSGRMIRRLASGQGMAETLRVSWDGREQNGRPVTPGVYYARLASIGGAAKTLPLIVVR